MTAQIGTDFIRASATSPASNMLMLMTLATGFVMAMIDVTAVNVALPDIALSLSIPLSGLVWVVDGYTLTFATLLLAGGTERLITIQAAEVCRVIFS